MGKTHRQALCPVCGTAHGMKVTETIPGKPYMVLKRRNYWEITLEFDPQKPFGVIQEVGMGMGRSFKVLGYFSPEEDQDGFFPLVKNRLLQAVREWRAKGWISEEEVKELCEYIPPAKPTPRQQPLPIPKASVPEVVEPGIPEAKTNWKKALKEADDTMVALEIGQLRPDLTVNTQEYQDFIDSEITRIANKYGVPEGILRKQTLWLPSLPEAERRTPLTKAEIDELIASIKPKAKPVKPEAKEPWQMTKEEWLKLRTGNYLDEIRLIKGGTGVTIEKRRLDYGIKDRWIPDTLKSGKLSKSRGHFDVEGKYPQIIEKALIEGKPVPPEVLANYPG